MNLSEQVSYLKGLIEGLEIDKSNKEGKIILEMASILENMAYSVEQLEEANSEMTELVDMLDQDLGDVEEYVYDDDCDCGHSHSHYHDDDEFYDDEALYEVKCGDCGETIVIDDEILDEGGMTCPNCNAEIDFDIDAMDLEEEKKSKE